MEINIKRDELLKTMAVVEKAIAKQTTIPAIQGMYLEATIDELVLVANNLGLAIKGSTPAEIIEIGKVVVPSKFCEIIRNLQEDIHITVKDERASILSGQSVFQLNCMNADDFPIFSKEQESWETVTFKDGELKKVLSKVLFAVSQDPGRPVFTGVKISMIGGKFSAISTDTYRMAEFSTSVENEKDFQMIVPGVALNQIHKALSDGGEEAKFFFSDKELLVKYKQFTFRLPLIEGSFPNTDSIWPQSNKTSISVEPGLISQVINRASLLAAGERKMVTLSINNKVKVTTASETGKTSEVIDGVEKSGEELECVYLNAGFLQDGIKALNNKEKINISFNGQYGPCVFTGENYRYLVLPIRIN